MFPMSNEKKKKKRAARIFRVQGGETVELSNATMKKYKTQETISKTIRF